jgi:hypothetical protein
MLLTPEQKVERARSLLGTAFGLALAGSGWKVHSSPGEFHLERGDKWINPFKVILRLSDGDISKDAWAAKCKELEIEDLQLSIAEESSSASQNK